MPAVNYNLGTAGPVNRPGVLDTREPSNEDQSSDEEVDINCTYQPRIV